MTDFWGFIFSRGTFFRAQGTGCPPLGGGQTLLAWIRSALARSHRARVESSIHHVEAHPHVADPGEPTR